MAVRLVKSQLPSHSTLYRDKYNGGTPTAKYITNFYKKQLKSIKSHLQKEVKKRDAEVLAVDVDDFPYKDDEQAAIQWCSYVDGVTIHAKLPFHMRP